LMFAATTVFRASIFDYLLAIGSLFGFYS
jgi:hypothetical protein